MSTYQRPLEILLYIVCLFLFFFFLLLWNLKFFSFDLLPVHICSLQLVTKISAWLASCRWFIVEFSFSIFSLEIFSKNFRSLLSCNAQWLLFPEWGWRCVLSWQHKQVTYSAPGDCHRGEVKQDYYYFTCQLSRPLTWIYSTLKEA